MNANSKPTTLRQWLKEATTKLTGYSTTPWLDAKVIAEHVLGGYWFWKQDEPIARPLTRLDRVLDLRRQGLPIAYIVGKKEFYGRDFATPYGTVLIPRPETEMLIELLRELRPQPNDKLLDVGTGSGAIAITAALEWPDVRVYATDISEAALTEAVGNAKKLGASVTFAQSHLLQHAPEPPYRFIVANLPYVDSTWQRSPETAHEPAIALFAEDGGLTLIKQLIAQTSSALLPEGYLLLEADPRQHGDIIAFAAKHHLKLVRRQDFALAFQYIS